MNELNVKEVEKEFYILCNNIDDIILDIPNANIKFIKLFNELNITKKNNILLMLQNIDDNDSGDDSNDDSNDDSDDCGNDSDDYEVI